MRQVSGRRFVAGCALGAALMLALNLLPYWQTRGRARFDGHETIGFPLTFRRVGGFVNLDEWYVAALAADVALGLIAALLVGWMVGRSRRKPSG